MRWIGITVVGATLLMCALARAQVQTSALAPPSAPRASATPATGVTPRPIRPIVKRRRLAFLESPRLYRVAQGLMFSSAGFDYLETAGGMTSRSQLHLTVISPGLTQTVVLDLSNRFAEGGWAKFVGPHNVGGVIALNAGVDVLLALAARHLARRGPRWRMVATAMLVERVVAHLVGGSSWIGLSGRVAAPYAQFNPIWEYP